MNTAQQDDAEEVWPTAEERAASIALAMSLRDQAASGGLRFEAYLPPALATWLIDRIVEGTFLDPSEAVLVMLGDQHDLEPHADLRVELVRRSIQAAIDDPRPSIPAGKVFADLSEQAARPRPPAAVWPTRPTAPE